MFAKLGALSEKSVEKKTKKTSGCRSRIISWQPLSRPKLTVLGARQPPPCTPWLSCRFTKPRRSNRCTRVVPTRGWCRSCARRLTSLYERRKSQRGPSGRRCPPWWSRSTISGSTWQRWRTSTRHAFSTPPGRAVRRHRRGLRPAVLDGTAAEAIQHILLRRDAPSTAAPWARPQSAHRRGRPPASQPGHKSSRKSGKRPWRGQPGDVGVCSFSGDGENSAAPSPGGGPGGESSVSFCFCSGTHLLKERAISFSSGFSGPWDNSVRRPASSLSPTTHFASSQESTVRGRHSSPRTSGQSVRDPGNSVRMPQNAPPSAPSTPYSSCCTNTGTSIVPLEPLAQRLEAWLTLPSLSRWLTRTIRLGCAFQFARRPPKFNGILETSVAFQNTPVLREEIAVLLA